MAARERCDVSGAPAVKWQAELTISKWETGSRKTGAHVTHPLAELGEVAEDGGSEVTREFFVRKMVFLLNVLCVSAGKDERAEFLRQELSGSYRKSHAERIVHQVFLQVNSRSLPHSRLFLLLPPYPVPRTPPKQHRRISLFPHRYHLTPRPQRGPCA